MLLVQRQQDEGGQLFCQGDANCTVLQCFALVMSRGTTNATLSVGWCGMGVNAVRKSKILLAVALCALGANADSLCAQDGQATPTVWMAPPSFDNGKCFRELFDHPDAWKQTRSAIEVLMYADHQLDRQFTDDELRAWFAQLQKWRLKFALEVGAVKPWGVTGAQTFEIQRRKWDRFRKLGGDIHAVALDEPLLCCRKHIDKTDEYAVQETANFIKLVRHHYPEMLIGDIETYPSIPLEDHFWWLDALEKRLAEMQVRGLDFYRLDVNWVTYTVRSAGSWRDVRRLEQHCRQRKLPFSLIYWASAYPALDRKKLADDSTWYVSIMQQGYDYALVDGAPDQYVIESWLKAPSRSTPETDPFTFTRSVLDFTRKFVKPSGE